MRFVDVLALSRPDPLVGPDRDEWRSSQGRKAGWKYGEVYEAAVALHDALPIAAKHLVQRADWRGGALVPLEDMSGWRVSEKDCANNEKLLAVALQLCPDTVKSAFFWSDVWMEVMCPLRGKLLSTLFLSLAKEQNTFVAARR